MATPGGERAAQASQPAGSPPSPPEAMAAYQMVDRWVREWRIGERDGTETPGNPGGASVTLRLDGRVIGRGVDVSGGTDCVRVAAGLALAEAAGRLPVAHDALMDEHRRAMAERITLSLELAGPLVPFSPAEYADAAADISPGIDGVACRFGGAVAAMFPMQMLVSGMDGARGLSAAVAKAASEPAKGLVTPADLARDDHAVFYRFKTVHLAQLAPRATPTFLDRGGRVIPQSEMTTAELRRWADGLADNLIRRMHPGPEKYGLRGTYNPVTGEYEAPFAPPAEQVAAVLALSAYTSVTRDGARADAVDRAIERVQTDLLTAEPGETPAWESAAVAPALWTFERVRVRAGDAPGLGDAASESVRAATADLVGDDGRFSPRIGAGERAFALYVLALSAEVMDAEGAAGVFRDVGAGLDALYRDAPAGGLVTHMPWLGYAELTRSRGGAIGSAVALREMRSQTWRNMLGVGVEPDLAGAIVFTAGRAPAPTWLSARPVAFLAAMLGDPRLTEGQEVMPELARLVSALRFLRQLSAGAAECHMYADPDAAMWGVRASPWDQRMPVDASAVTLLAVCDALRSLGAVSARSGSK